MRRGFDAWNRGDAEALADLVSADVELDVSDRELNPATYTGLDGARHFQAEIREVWDEFRVEIEDAFPAPDVARTDGRRITHLRLYRDRAAALATAGLPPRS